jgi:ubiquinone/menaquinone biosynthesis C-methylase UbiE
VSGADPDSQRLEMLDRWGLAAAGWSARADDVRAHGMPVSRWMIEHLHLQAGQRVLELAAGPGDTGFLAAELIAPDGKLISSDGADAMLDIARARARQLGVENVEFAQLQLEWIDLPTASVDAILCRWGLMLTVDPATALSEARRVLRPGGRIALAVWDQAPQNPWATIPSQALVRLGHASPPEPDTPGMFALAAPGQLQEMLESAGFIEVLVEAVGLDRSYQTLEAYLEETLDLSRAFAEVFERLTDQQRAEVRAEIAALAAPYVSARGSVSLPGSSLVAAAGS